MSRTGPLETHHIALGTTHPAKFATAVEKADIQFEALLPGRLVGLDNLPRKL